MTMDGTILHHPDFAFSLNNLRLDFANLLIDQRGDILLSIQDRLAGLDDAVWTQRIGNTRPTQRWL